VRRALAAAVAAIGVGCAARQGFKPAPAGRGEPVATYRLVLQEETGPSRRVRLILWVGRPDRLHAEIVPPVGGVRFTLDAGGGRACVIDAADGVAYAGSDGVEAVDALTGIRITVPEAVAALLDGAAPPGWSVERDGDAPGELPRRLHLASGARSMTLTLENVVRSIAAGPLGTGAPPAGLPVRPLEELARAPRDSS
jgi:hypothetical protein